MKKPLLIFPYSGSAIEALDCLGTSWECVGFISDDENFIGKTEFGIKIFDRSVFNNLLNAKVLAVHGSPQSYKKRESILKNLGVTQDRFASVIHPNSSIGEFAKIGLGTLIMAGVVVTSNAIIGNHVIVLPNSVIHHDSVINDYTLIGANVTVAGNVTIGNSCYIGAASSIKNGTIIPEHSLVGMGANVIKTYTNSSILIGNPARPLEL